MADGQVVFEITADGKKAVASVKDVTSAIEKETKKWDRATDAAAREMESGFVSTIKKIGAAISAAKIGQALLHIGKDAVEAASALAEVQNVVDVTFGSGASQIDAWARTAGRQFGLTETQAKKFTSTLGAMMKSSGITGDEIIGMSTNLAGLAADMASFYNLDFETAFQKIRSGISGETEPLKQLGINMSVANLEAFALEQGITQAFSAMSQGEQTLLRYQYLMQATSDAQGDFARTSDSFANASRRVEAAFDTIQTKGGAILLSVIEPLTSGIADFLTQITTPPETTIFDDFNAAELNTAAKMADLEETYKKAQDIIKILDEIGQEAVTLKDGTTISFEKLFEDLGNVEKNGGDVQGYIQSLGLNVDEIITKYSEWKEATRQLTSLVPGLTSAIDSETGAIDGGTEALKRNLDQWKANEEKKIYWAEYYAKAEAVARAKGEQAGIQIEAKARKNAAERAAQELAEKFGTTFAGDGKIWDRFTGDSKEIYESGGFNNAEVDEAFENYNRKLSLADEAQKKAAQSANDLVDAEALLAEEYKATVELVGEEDSAFKAAGNAAQDAGEKTSEAWETAKNAAADAVKALSDYVAGVHDATAQAVNSIIKGFETVTKAGDNLRQQSAEYAGKEVEILKQYDDVLSKWKDSNGAVNLEKMGKNWDNLTSAEQEAYNALAEIHNKQNEINKGLDQYKPDAMKAGLQSQIDYMTEYIDNLGKAKEMGLSDDLLASLADGTAESAEYLAGLVSDAEGAKEVDALFQKMQEVKNGFTDTLTQQKLTVDEMYQGMIDSAKAAIDGMSLGEEAAAASGETVSGLASGISSHVSEVSAAVSAILAELDRLSGWGVSIDLGSFGSFGFSLGLDGEHATGLDYVPFDGYLAGLHEGEGILTAEENRIWQRFKNGGMASQNSGVSGSDLDTILGTNLKGVKAGGDVYLDGRTVGQVISAQQGRSFRSLQRSGWQQ